MTTLQQRLPRPVDPETEQAFAQVLREKVSGAVGLFVTAMRTLEALQGPDAVQAVRERMVNGAGESDDAHRADAELPERSLRAFCANLETACLGSHEWVKLEDSDTRQAYRFTRCLWAEVFRELGAPELGFWICAGDGPGAAAFNPRIRFQRTQTLMLGDDCCDHIFYTEE
ncbi:MAG: L-2-amino-thiazoline-4-carboxylic acid hydrolase [Anaerolineae bacterium]